jgi:arabinogalactan endo-1,4-beta-galactosidase
MNDLVARYGKEVMICEVGMGSSAAQAGYELLTDLIAKTQSVSAGKGLGVFYWEPECYNWAGYSKGAWNTNGRPSTALDAFINGRTLAKPGDVNVDSEINSLDYALFKRYIINPLQTTISSEGKINMDIDLDGAINSIDVMLLRRMLL